MMRPSSVIISMRVVVFRIYLFLVCWLIDPLIYLFCTELIISLPGPARLILLLRCNDLCGSSMGLHLLGCLLSVLICSGNVLPVHASAALTFTACGPEHCHWFQDAFKTLVAQLLLEERASSRGSRLQVYLVVDEICDRILRAGDFVVPYSLLSFSTISVDALPRIALAGSGPTGAPDERRCAFARLAAGLS